MPGSKYPATKARGVTRRLGRFLLTLGPLTPRRLSSGNRGLSRRPPSAPDRPAVSTPRRERFSPSGICCLILHRPAPEPLQLLTARFADTAEGDDVGPGDPRGGGSGVQRLGGRRGEDQQKVGGEKRSRRRAFETPAIRGALRRREGPLLQSSRGRGRLEVRG